MFRKIIALFSLFVLVSNKGFSISPHIIDTSKIFNQIKKFDLNDNLLNNKDFFNSIVFKNDSTLYYNPDNTLLLFEIYLNESPNVNLLSNSNHYGQYRNRHLFIYNNILYSYGGEGLFNSNQIELLYYDDLVGFWSKKEINNYPFDTKKVLNSWKIDSKIMVLLNLSSESNENNSQKLSKFSFGEIDLNNFKFTQHFSFKGTYQDLLFHSGLGFYRGNYIYDSELFSIHGYYQDYDKIDYRIFDKISGSLKRNSRLDAINRVDGLSYLYIKDSTIYHRDRFGVVDTFGVNTGDIIHSKDFLQIYQSKKKDSWQYYFIILIIVLICLFVIVKKLKIYLFNNSQYSSSNELKAIEGKLRKLDTNIISKEALDDLFGISHYSYETIKTKRSFLIRNLNDQSKIKIERVRDQNDKRYFNYKIS